MVATAIETMMIDNKRMFNDNVAEWAVCFISSELYQQWNKGGNGNVQLTQIQWFWR